MTSVEELEKSQCQAARYYREGNARLAIDTQVGLVEELFHLGPEIIQNQAKLGDLLEKAASQLVDALRWEKDYDRAISYQDRLADFFPDAVPAIRLGSANLRIEAGQTDEGIQELSDLVEKDSNNIWAQINLGAAYLMLERYGEAEVVLRTAANLPYEGKRNRAIAYTYLFYVYAYQENMDQALSCWKEACRLDPGQKGMTTEVYRWLASTRRYDEMQKLVFTEKQRHKKLFYQGFTAFKHGNFVEANKYWKMLVADFEPEQVKGAEDEYAEACIQLINPTRAIMALEPLVEKGHVQYFRLVILGLAWAQKRALERASWYLERALRLGELEKPRRTRSAPQGSILDIHARMLYAHVVIDQDIRQALNRYFIPIKGLQE